MSEIIFKTIIGVLVVGLSVITLFAVGLTFYLIGPMSILIIPILAIGYFVGTFFQSDIEQKGFSETINKDINFVKRMFKR